MQGTASADTELENKDNNFKIDALEGNDKIYNVGASNVSIDAGAGNDTIYLTPSVSGADSIYGGNVSIYGGAGNDVIYAETGTVVVSGTTVSVTGYDMYAKGHVYVFGKNDGNDTIYGFNPNDAIAYKDGDASISSAVVKNYDVVLTIGKTTVTLKDYMTKVDLYDSPIKVISSDGVNVDNYYIPKEILGTSGNDKDADSSKVTHAVSLANGDYDNFAMYGYGGNDSIINNVSASNVTMDGGAGNDSLFTNGDNGSIGGGAGNDVIILSDTAVGNTVVAGTGNDKIYYTGSIEDGGNIYQFGTADGINTIYGFTASDKLQFVDSTGNIKASDTTEIKIDRTDEGQVVTYRNTTIILKNYGGIGGAGSDIDGGLEFTAEVLYSDNSVSSATRVTDLKILGTTGNDTGDKAIKNLVSLYAATGSSDSYHIEARAGNDSIINDGSFVTIDGGLGNDTISLVGSSNDNSKATANKIIGGKGNDVIYGNDAGGHVYVYNSGDGNDTIYGFNVAEDSISIGAEYSTVLTSNGFMIKVGTGSILVKGEEEDGSYKNLAGGDVLNLIKSDGNSDTVVVPNQILGTNGNDLLTNDLSDYEILAQNGNDSIINYDGGDNVKIDAGAGNDRITLFGGDNVFIDAGKGNDEIVVYDVEHAKGHYYEIKAGYGNTSIRGLNSNDTIHFDGNLTIKNREFVGTGANAAYVLTLSDNTTKLYLQGINGADSSTATFGVGINVLKNTTFNVMYGSSTDTQVLEVPNEVKVTGTDTAYLSTSSSGVATVDATKGFVYGDKQGNNIINLKVDNVIIESGAGNDSIEVQAGEHNTISGGTGNDTITLANGGHLIQYNKNDGNDVITGWNEEDTLQISGITKAQIDSIKGNDGTFTLKIGTGKIEFKDIAVCTKIKIEGVDSLTALEVPRKIEGTTGNDKGVDALENSGEDIEKYTIMAYAGNDSIFNDVDGNEVYIDAGAGNDSITNKGDKVTILGGAGNDIIFHDGRAVSIDAGLGNDTISLSSSAAASSVIGGKGNDVIYSNNSAEGNHYFYNSGDGNDTIVGYNSGDSIHIDGSLSVTGSGIQDGGYVISLKGGSTLTTLTLRGKKTAGVADSLNGVQYFDPLAGGTEINLVIGGTPSVGTVPMEKYVTKGVAFTNPEEDQGYKVSGLAGIDTITNNAINTSIVAGSGNDIIINNAAQVSIDAGDGNDLILMNTVTDSAISTLYSAFNSSDTVKGLAEAVTVVAGKGNDTIVGPGNEVGNIYKFAKDQGHDVIYGFTENDSLDLGGSNIVLAIKNGYTIVNTTGADGKDDPKHKDVVFKLGSGTLTLKNLEVDQVINIVNNYTDTSVLDPATIAVDKYHTLSATEGRSASSVFENSISGYYLDGKTTADFITNYAEQVSIVAGNGNNSINNVIIHPDSDIKPASVSITAGTGNDTINNEGQQVAISISAGKNVINNKFGADETSIIVGAGNDSIVNYANSVTIDAGKGKNTIISGYYDSTYPGARRLH